MAKFHINKHGVPAPCKAKPGNCPLGGDDTHFNSKEEAQLHADKLNEEKHGILPKVKTSKRKKSNRQQKVDDGFAKIAEGVQAVFSSENYKNYLDTMSKFHRYSVNNSILIHMQKPNATKVAGYNKWKKEFGRQVSKGEKGIMILAPRTYSNSKYVDKRDSKGNVVKNSDGNPVKEKKVSSGVYFRPAYVFDVSQTTGKELPKLVNDLEGSSAEARAVVDSIQEVSSSKFEMKSTDDDDILMKGAKGYYSPSENKIVINKDLSEVHQAKTAIHEFAHAEMHKNSDSTREQKEVEAESVAYVLSDHFGLDTSDYSFPYIAAWNGRSQQELTGILENIKGSTSDLIERLDPVFNEKIKEN